MAAQRQNAPRFIGQGLALLGTFVDAGQLQHIRARGQHIRVIDHGYRPLASLHQLWGTNAAIGVLVNQVQRDTVKLNTPGGTGQGHPQLLVQLANVGDIGTGANLNLIHPSRTEKLPLMLLHECVVRAC